MPRLRLWIPAIVFAGLVIMTEAGVVVMWIVLGRDSHAFENKLFKLVGLARYGHHIRMCRALALVPFTSSICCVIHFRNLLLKFAVLAFFTTIL